MNRDAAEVMKDFPVHACTDITGFGFLGHLAEMVEGSGPGVRVESERVPILPETLTYAGMGLVPAGAHNNRAYRAAMVDFAPTVDAILQDVLFDPQTSGGLLIGLGGDRAEALVAALKEKGIAEAAIVGEAVPEPRGRIIVR